MSDFKTLQRAWHAFTNGASHLFFNFLDPLASSIGHNGGKVLTDAAAAGVSTAMSIPGGGEVKFAAAFASVVAILTAEGIPVVENAVRGAIEAAVAAQKAQSVVIAPTEIPAAQ